jgi:predicted DNA-binding transcriptional regulator AlpA
VIDVGTLLADPSRALEIPAEDVPTLLGRVAAEQARLAAVQTALVARMAEHTPERGDDADALLTVIEAARLIGMSPRWLYKNAHRLPFTRRVGPRALRFSRRGIARYLDKRPSVI